MIIFFDILFIIILFSLFGILHSLTANKKLKLLIAEKLPELLPFYRLFYNFLSVIIFIVIIGLAPKPNIKLYDLSFPFDIIFVIIQIFSLIGLFWTFRYVNLREFLGITQVLRYLKKEYDNTKLDEESNLIIEGPFKLVRHPSYFFSIMILLFRPNVDLFYLISFICILAYFWIGSYFEEEKLIDRFGNEYINYRKKVPRLFPIKL